MIMIMIIGGLSFGTFGFITVAVALTAIRVVYAALISLLQRTALVSYATFRGVNGSKIRLKGQRRSAKMAKFV